MALASATLPHRFYALPGWLLFRPPTLLATSASLRGLIASIEPAIHGISAKTFANIQSDVRGALALTGIIDPIGRGAAGRDPSWSPLVDAVAESKPLACGMARFFSFCSMRHIEPDDVGDDTVLAYLVWMETRTIVSAPAADARRVPRLWEFSSGSRPGLAEAPLGSIGVGLAARKTGWAELPELLRVEAEA